MAVKVSWRGVVLGIQPRIRLTRSFDERAHTYLGYALRVDGIVDGKERMFFVGIGKAAQQKHEIRVGDSVSGTSCPVADPRNEAVEYYKTSKLKTVERTNVCESECPPWGNAPPMLEIYRQRGHRRLAARTYESKCLSCIWGCRMPVEMIIDQWNPQERRYRFETFCYGPKACSLYKAGPTRKVPGRKGMTYEEPDWVDEQDTEHRGMED